MWTNWIFIKCKHFRKTILCLVKSKFPFYCVFQGSNKMYSFKNFTLPPLSIKWIFALNKHELSITFFRNSLKNLYTRLNLKHFMSTILESISHIDSYLFICIYKQNFRNIFSIFCFENLTYFVPFIEFIKKY